MEQLDTYKKRNTHLSLNPSFTATTPPYPHPNPSPAGEGLKKVLLQPSHCPSAAMPFSLARACTMVCALPKLPTRSCDHSFNAADCMARP